MKEKDRKRTGILICVLIGMTILFASLVFSEPDQPTVSTDELTDYSNEWQVTTKAGAFSERINLPAHTQDVALGDTLIVEKKLPDQIKDQSYLFFRASHQKVRVLINGKDVYSFGTNENQLFGKTPACAWILVPLEKAEGGSRLQVELTGVYPRYTNLVNAMYLGDKASVIHDIIIKRAGSAFICICLLVIGVGMISVSLALRDRKTTMALNRLGVLTVIIGSWSLCIINILQVIYPNVYVLLNFEFFMFNLILPVFLWFLSTFPYYREKKWLNWFFWFSMIHFFVIEMLQVTNTADYMETLIISHILQGGVILWIIGTGIYDLARKKASQEVDILILSVIVITFFAGIDVIRSYSMNIVDESFYLRLGTLIFIFLWSVAVIKNMSNRLIATAKTEALEVLAYVDLMTGLKNRTAFEQWMEQYRPQSVKDEIYLFIFDMNGLKEINDRFGHLSGDKAIITISNIIKQIFLPYEGNTYRIGGDEICAILTKGHVDDELAETLVSSIQEEVSKRSSHSDVTLTVAAGYSDVSLQNNKNVLDAYREADRRMYENKITTKQKQAEG